MSVRHERVLPLRSLTLSIAAASLGYLAIALWSGWQEVTWAALQVGAGGMAAVLAMSLLNYALRFLRWQMYLAELDHHLPWFVSGRIYLAGFALTTTPGKAGEAIRSVLLERWGVGYSASLAALLSERLSDLSAIVLWALWGLPYHPQARPIVVAAAAGAALAAVVLSQAWWLRRGHDEGHAARRGGLAPWRRRLAHLLFEARRCHRPRLLVAATALSLVAWSAEAAAFHWILGWLGADYSARFAFFVYAVSMLAGALSFLPGGLGGAEAAMVGLLVWKGLALPQAVAATVLIRLATLWFAVALGVIALVFERGSPAPAT